MCSKIFVLCSLLSVFHALILLANIRICNLLFLSVWFACDVPGLTDDEARKKPCFLLSPRSDAMLYREYAKGNHLYHQPDAKLVIGENAPQVSASISSGALVRPPVGSESNVVQPYWTSTLLPFLNNTQHSNVQFLDTHSVLYLDGRAPDISIVPRGSSQATPDNVVAVIELKKSLDSSDDMQTGRGQTVSYLETTLAVQPSRDFVYGAVTDNNHFTLMKLTRNKKLFIIREVSFGNGAEEVLDWLCSSTYTALGYTPVIPLGLSFTSAKLLGWGAFAVGYSGIYRSQGQELPTVFKRYGEQNAYVTEVKALKLFAKKGITHVPHLITCWSEESCTVTSPIGRPFSVEHVPTLQHAIQLIDTLKAVHEAEIVHRDIKLSNIFDVDGELLLNDWGNAEFVPDRFLATRNKSAEEADVRMAVCMLAGVWDPHNTHDIYADIPGDYQGARDVLTKIKPHERVDCMCFRIVCSMVTASSAITCTQIAQSVS